jgi:hypothetical protein
MLPKLNIQHKFWRTETKLPIASLFCKTSVSWQARPDQRRKDIRPFVHGTDAKTLQ